MVTEEQVENKLERFLFLYSFCEFMEKGLRQVYQHKFKVTHYDNFPVEDRFDLKVSCEVKLNSTTVAILFSEIKEEIGEEDAKFPITFWNVLKPNMNLFKYYPSRICLYEQLQTENRLECIITFYFESNNL